MAYDAGTGLIAGYSGAVMLVGINPVALAVAVAGPVGQILGPRIDPKAAILSRGWNVGPQASAGITGQVGYMWHHAD